MDTNPTSLTPDLNAAAEFLFLLGAPLEEKPSGEAAPETKHTFFTVGDTKAANVRPESRYGTLAQHGSWLEKQNKRGAGVFVCIHEMDASNNRKEENFKRIRTVVADLDHGLPDKPWPCTPTMIVTTSPGKQHVYWLVGDDMTKDAFVSIQGRLIADYQSDKQVKDLSRVLRLPGFYHRKTALPHMVTFEVPGSEPAIYGSARLLREFPPLPNTRNTTGKGAVSTEVLPPALARLTTGAKKKTLDEVEEALSHLDADDRGTWVNFGHAIKRDHGEAGLDVWLGWSAKSKLYEEEEARRKWDGFDVSDSGPDKLNCGTIIHLAKVEKARHATVVARDLSGTVRELAGNLTPEFSGKSQDPNSIKNIAIFLDKIGIEPWHNEFDGDDYLRNQAGHDDRLTDSTALDLKMRMHAAGLRVSSEFCNDALMWVASKRTAHPVRKYLEGFEQDGKTFKWDREPRLDTWLHTYCGAQTNKYHQLVGSKWMIAAARRVRDPGCKFDNMLVLEGAQNAGKSTVFRILASDAWFTDGMSAGTASKETIEVTRGKWIVECAELAGLTKRDVNEVKQALSKQTDRARLSYGRFAVEVPRQFVFCGTTNSAKYLMDVTGGRRFWCVATGKIDLDALRRDRNQLWAEAAHRAEQGEPIYLKDAEFDLATEEQAKREVDDPLEIQVEELIGGFKYGVVAKADVYIALGYEDASKGGGTVGAKLGPIMSKLGWRDGSRMSIGGKQRRYYVADPVKADDCDAPPPQRVLTLVRKDKGAPAYFMEGGTLKSLAAREEGV